MHISRKLFFLRRAWWTACIGFALVLASSAMTSVAALPTFTHMQNWLSSEAWETLQLEGNSALPRTVSWNLVPWESWGTDAWSTGNRTAGLGVSTSAFQDTGDFPRQAGVPGWMWPNLVPHLRTERPDEAVLSQPKNVFGTVSLRVSQTVHAARWAEVLAEKADRLLTDGCMDGETTCDAPLFKRLAAALHGAKRVDSVEGRIAIVNSAVNTLVRFATDDEVYGRPDYWASFHEVVVRGRGDCEDIALTKMWLLRAAGVPPEAIHLVLSRETRRQVDHAVLVVRVGSRNLVLDNLSEDVKADTALSSYQPLVSLATNGSWVHGYRTSGL